MFASLSDLDGALGGLVPVARDRGGVREQRDSNQDFLAKLRELMTNAGNAGDSCRKMMEAEASPDLLGLKRDLDALSKQCSKLQERARGRAGQVDSTLAKLEELYSNLQQFKLRLGEAEGKEDSQGVVGMETEVINQQLEAFKVRGHFCKAFKSGHGHRNAL